MNTEIKSTDQLLSDFYRFFETANETLLEATTSKQLKDHDRNPMSEGTDYEALLSLGQSVKGLSEMQHNLTQINTLENGNLMIRWEASAKHTGELFGFEPTNRTVYFNGHDILKIENGKIVELWHIEQLFQLTAQLQ